MSYQMVKIGKLSVDIGLKEPEVKIIQAKTPVRTGTLRDGFKLDGKGGIINDVYYGIYVELGTGPYYKGELGPGSGRPWGMRGRYMVERSMEEMRWSVIKRILEQLDIRRMVELPDEIIMDFTGKDYLEFKSERYAPKSITF